MSGITVMGRAVCMVRVSVTALPKSSTLPKKDTHGVWQLVFMCGLVRADN